VLLVEAGDAAGPAAMADPLGWPALLGGGPVDWSYQTVEQPGLAGARLPVPRVKVLGGAGAMYHIRGRRSNIDA
jgi:choline dehydrogenase